MALIGARQRSLGADDAKSYVLENSSELAWIWVVAKYSSWERFCIAFNRDYAAGFEGRFEQSLKDEIAAFVLDKHIPGGAKVIPLERSN